MKKTLLIPAVSVLSGACALVLCLLQQQTGFEAATGLPIPGAFASRALVILLAAAVLVLALLCGILLRESGAAGDLSAFSTDAPTRLMLPVAGSLLMGLSGALDLAQGLGLGNQTAPILTAEGLLSSAASAGEFSPTIHMVLGVLSLLSAASLFSIAAACRRREGCAPAPNASLALVTPVALVVRLVFTYRLYSANPVLEEYYVELLALIFLTLGFYRLSSFAFSCGHTARFSFYAAVGVLFCMAASVNSIHMAATLLYLGGGAVLLGFLLLRLMQTPSNQ